MVDARGVGRVGFADRGMAAVASRPNDARAGGIANKNWDKSER